MRRSRVRLFSLAALLAIASSWAGASKTSQLKKAENDRVEIRVEPLSRNQVKKRFVSGLHGDYLVIKVTLIPSQGADLNVSRDHFSLQDQEGEAFQSQTPEIIARQLHQQQDTQRVVTVAPTAEIGYSSGRTDPTTGDPRWSGDPRYRRKGVYYGGGVGVGIGSGPGVTDQDREVMELELSEMALPEGPAAGPVSGHLYFHATVKKGRILRLAYQDAAGDRLTFEFKRP